jgi:hypothetical protein
MKKRDEARVGTALRLQLVLLLDSARESLSRFVDHPDADMLFDDDPAVVTLYERTFSTDAALALTQTEATLLHEAALAAHRAVDQIVVLKPGAGTGSVPEINAVRARITETARSAVDKLCAARTALAKKKPHASGT